MEIPKQELTLDQQLSFVWGKINASVRNKKNAMHSPVLSMQGESVSPRTLILRGVNQDLRQCFFFSDIRSQKIKSIKQSKNGFLHAYDYQDQLQLRVKGEISFSYDNTLTRFWWDKLSDYSKKVYCTNMNPGQALSQPQYLVSTYDKDKIDNGYKNFSVLTFIINEIDCLVLGRGIPIRSLHQWSDQKLTQCWLAP